MTSMPEAVVLGQWFEDFEIGQERLTPGRTITEVEINNFAGVTGDFSQVHTDEEFCKKTEFGTRIAHGLLILSVVAGLKWRTNYTQGTGVASLGWNNCRFIKPVMIGDTIRGRWCATEKRESKSKPGMGIVTEQVEAINQRREVVMSAEHTIMVRRRPDAA
jgi:acyl dehydratase